MFALLEDDRKLLHPKTRPVCAISELDLESVAIGVRVGVIDPLERGAPEALEAAGEIADRHAEDHARVEAAAPARRPPADRPVLDAPAVDVARADHEVGVV